ncbi:response regulator [Schlesneria sp. T3-172]|uniref:response regulator n=1 Tax=Schlesneria sphaerica TaxID=3373610 RepID=UPI0037C7AD8A
MSHETVGRPMEILLVEDSLMFARIAIGALKNGRILHRLTWLSDGSEALQFLKREGKYAAAPRPDLLLLDLKLPGIDGVELLARVRSDEDLKSLPVVVMTADGEQAQLGELSVEAFLTKPMDLAKFIEIVQKLSSFWQADMVLPSTDHHELTSRTPLQGR